MISETLDLINSQNAEKEALIAGQETLQKHIAEQKAEIERLKNELANISAKTLKKFEKNIKDVKVTLGQTWEIQNAIKETLKEMVGDV